MIARLPSRSALLPVAMVAAAFALALALRLRQEPAPLASDEYASLYFSGRSFAQLWGPWMLRETNPPLFYSLLKLWRMAVPETQPALRLLPLLLSLAQIALVARIAGKRWGWAAAAMAVLLLALSPSDIYQSEYLRGYVLAKLAVTVSFIGLLAALEHGRPSDWALYAGGAVVAIYSHTTMLLWPAIATLAVLAEAALRRGVGRTALLRLLAANLAVALLSAWVLWVAAAQVHAASANIAWIEPLSFDDWLSSVNLQLLLDGEVGSALMVVLMAIGVLRTFADRATRLALFVLVGGLAAFKVADRIHPIISDYTLHWCAGFTVLLAAAALAGSGRAPGMVARGGVLALTAAVGLYELVTLVWIPEPQDWRRTVETVARTPDAALLVAHESVGLVVQQACMLEFHRPGCPFPLVVMASRAPTDAWAFGGYRGRVIPVRQVPAALRPARRVYAFSRYVYTPLPPLGLDESRYRRVEWDDGELIGPIPASDFRKHG